jgi:hypothetical protein
MSRAPLQFAARPLTFVCVRVVHVEDVGDGAILGIGRLFVDGERTLVEWLGRGRRTLSDGNYAEAASVADRFVAFGPPDGWNHTDYAASAALRAVRTPVADLRHPNWGGSEIGGAYPGQGRSTQ